MEDLRGQVNIGAKDLVEGYQVTPLREFVGVLEDFVPERDEQYNRIRISLQFTDVEVIESTEPYPFPIVQLTVPFSQRKRSQMGFLVNSLDKVMPGATLSSLVKQRVRMKVVSENFGRWRGETEDRIRGCWEIQEITSKPKVAQSAYEVALGLAEGKSPTALTEFYQQAFKNSAIKADKEVLDKILRKTFIEEAIEAGALYISDDGLIERASS